MIAVVSASRVIIVAHAPFDPSEQQLPRLRPQEYSTGEEMTNGVHGDAELGGTVYEATASATGLLSFRLADGDPIIEARNRSARSLARNAAAAITRLM
jgi:hypothetical protein